MNTLNSVPNFQNMLSPLYEGTPKEQVERAENIATWLRSEPALAMPLHALLPQLRQEAAQLAAQMQALGMGEACSACAARSFGGCCSACMAANCDVLLMVLNRLLGVQLSLQCHENQGVDACCFLAVTGCIFTVKPIFCLNYYCQSLRERTAPQEMHRLEVQAARVLGLQTIFEERLLQLLHKTGSVPCFG